MNLNNAIDCIKLYINETEKQIKFFSHPHETERLKKFTDRIIVLKHCLQYLYFVKFDCEEGDGEKDYIDQQNDEKYINEIEDKNDTTNNI